MAHQAPLSMGFPRQEYWSRLPCTPPRDLLNSGIEPDLWHCKKILYHSATWDVLSKWIDMQNSSSFNIKIFVLYFKKEKKKYPSYRKKRIWNFWSAPWLFWIWDWCFFAVWPQVSYITSLCLISPLWNIIEWRIIIESGSWASLVAQRVKNPPSMQEIPVLFLGLEDPLEKG